jgi:hypothetical protein
VESAGGIGEPYARNTELAGVRGEMAAADQRRAELEQALAEKREPLALGAGAYHLLTTVNS